jgi:hypothetical protein
MRPRSLPRMLHRGQGAAACEGSEEEWVIRLAFCLFLRSDAVCEAYPLPFCVIDAGLLLAVVRGTSWHVS